MKIFGLTNRNKHIILILVVIGSAIGMVTVLTAIALKPISQKNGFNRTFIDLELTQENAVKRYPGLLEISGTTTNKIYFSTKDPEKILATNLQLGNPSYINLNLNNTKSVSTAFNIIVDSLNFAVFAKNLPAIIITNPEETGTIYKMPASIFTKVTKITPESYIFRGFDTTVKTPDQIFLKANIRSGELTREIDISERNSDAGISTDGVLHYDKKTNLISYVFYYRNKFLLLDTNLKLIRVSKTIDTTYTNQTQAGELRSKKIITNLRPKRLVNYASTVYSGYLFNISKIKSDNEEMESFRTNAVIDIYNLSDGQYMGSFYLPNYKEEGAKKIRIIDGRLYVLYKNSIVSYTFNLANVRQKP